MYSDCYIRKINRDSVVKMVSMLKNALRGLSIQNELSEQSKAKYDSVVQAIKTICHECNKINIR